MTQTAPLSERTANAVYDVLEAECRAPVMSRDSFVREFTSERPTHEWRFQGALGFGGKIYMDVTRPHWAINPSPMWVSCYRENETPERLAMIDRANERLANLFAAAPLETRIPRRYAALRRTDRQREDRPGATARPRRRPDADDALIGGAGPMTLPSLKAARSSSPSGGRSASLAIGPGSGETGRSSRRWASGGRWPMADAPPAKRAFDWAAQ